MIPVIGYDTKNSRTHKRRAFRSTNGKYRSVCGLSFSTNFWTNLQEISSVNCERCKSTVEFKQEL